MSTRREFWINGGWARPENNFGHYDKGEIVHVQEIRPGEVVISREELRAALSKGSYCNDGSTDWQVVERELFGQEPGGGGEG
jgi:hypothetical protein